MSFSTTSMKHVLITKREREDRVKSPQTHQHPSVLVPVAQQTPLNAFLLQQNNIAPFSSV